MKIIAGGSMAAVLALGAALVPIADSPERPVILGSLS
jgi:hypothetical protein